MTTPSDETEHTSTEAHTVPASHLRAIGPNGGDLLVRVMRDAGAEVAFGVVSIHNLPLVEAIDRDLRFVPVRHEAAAINAADGYARASGRIGVAITSTGTGAGNAAGSMLEALTAQSRVLHVTGNINVESFDKALKKALKKGGPTIIEVDATALEPRPLDLVPPSIVPEQVRA